MACLSINYVDPKGIQEMNVKEAIDIAKRYIREIYSGEKIENLGLEEVEFEEMHGTWSVTLGFSRPWQHAAVGTFLHDFSPKRRDYKIIRISDKDGKVLSVKNREMAV